MPFVYREFRPGCASEMPPAPGSVQMLVIFGLVALQSKADLGFWIGWVCVFAAIIIAWRCRVSPWSIIGGGSHDDLQKLYNSRGARLND